MIITEKKIILINCFFYLLVDFFDFKIIDEDKLMEFSKLVHHQTKLNDSSQSLTSIPATYPQPDPSAYYNYYDYNYYDSPYFSAQR
jgi:hypothetical protein